MSENWQSEPVKTTCWIRRVIINAFLLLAAFLLGFVPMRWLMSQCSRSLARAKRQSSLARMQNSLASAAIDARRGDYETARLAASDFFTALRAETSKTLIRFSRRRKRTTYSPCLPSVMRPSLCLLVGMLLLRICSLICMCHFVHRSNRPVEKWQVSVHHERTEEVICDT